MKNSLSVAVLAIFLSASLVVNAEEVDSPKNSNADDPQSKRNDQHSVLLITGSPIRQSIEGSAEQLNEYDNQAIIDVGDLMTRFPGFSAIRAGGHGIDPVLRGQSQTRINILQQGLFYMALAPIEWIHPGLILNRSAGMNCK